MSNKTLSRQLVKPFRHSGAGDWRRLFCRERLTEGNRVQLHPSQVLLSCGMRPPMAQVRQRTGVERSALRNAHHRLRKDLKPTNQLHLQQNSSTTDLEPFLRTSHTPGQVRYSSVCKMPGSLSDVYSYRRQHRAWCQGKEKDTKDLRGTCQNVQVSRTVPLESSCLLLNTHYRRASTKPLMCI